MVQILSKAPDTYKLPEKETFLSYVVVQYLRAGNLLMLFATLINIRAPFMWSPLFTCS